MATDPRADLKTSTQSDENPSLSTLIGNIQSGITLIIAVGAFVTAAGVVIINVHLSKFTDIHGFSISSIQYLPAGVGFFLLLLINTIIFSPILLGVRYAVKILPNKRFSKILKTIQFGLAIIIMFVIYIALASYVGTRISNFSNLLSITTIFILIFREIDIIKVIRKPLSQAGLLMFLSLVSYAILGGYFYATSSYASIPHYLGGGQPASAILVFKDEATLNQLGFVSDPIQATHTQNILLLADLTDGILVLDPTTGHVISVKNESLLGTIDDKINTSYVVTATPMMTVSPSASPSPTP